MGARELLVAYWWPALIVVHALFLLAGVALWVAGRHPAAPLLALFGLLLPLAALATLLDGR